VTGVQTCALPILGQAKHVANLALLFKGVRHGWNAQIAGSYTGEKIAIVSHYLDSDYWQAPAFQMDASGEKKIGKSLTLFAKVNNILNTPSLQYIKTTNPYNDKFLEKELKKDYTVIRSHR
jgi:hypothetical protein